MPAPLVEALKRAVCKHEEKRLRDSTISSVAMGYEIKWVCVACSLVWIDTGEIESADQFDAWMQRYGEMKK